MYVYIYPQDCNVLSHLAYFHMGPPVSHANSMKRIQHSIVYTVNFTESLIQNLRFRYLTKIEKGDTDMTDKMQNLKMVNVESGIVLNTSQGQYRK